MSDIQLRIRQITVDLDDPNQGPRVEPALRAALQALGEKLANSPLAQDPGLVNQALAVLRLDPIPSSVLTGPGGPARVSELLYRQLLLHLQPSEAR